MKMRLVSTAAAVVVAVAVGGCSAGPADQPLVADATPATAASATPIAKLPHVDLAKKLHLEVEDRDGDRLLSVGDVAVWTITITNKSNTQVTDVTVAPTFPELLPVVCSHRLPAGRSAKCDVLRLPVNRDDVDSSVLQLWVNVAATTEAGRAYGGATGLTQPFSKA